MHPSPVPPSPMHPIMAASFAQIDAEFGPHDLTPAVYAIIRRVIHSTADFEYRDLVKFWPEQGVPGADRTGMPAGACAAIAVACAALRRQTPIIVDVTMVEQGIKTVVGQTFQNPVISAVAQADQALPGKTRTETGLLRCVDRHPTGIYVIGNAPTALLALCDQIRQGNAQPQLVIGAPVGFIAVLESKAALAALKDVPQIRVEGRKGGSAVAAAIVNALLVLAAEG